MATSSQHLPDSRFSHRFNGVAQYYDSICMACSRTVGSSVIEADLLDFENQHKCQGSILIDFLRGYRRTGMESIEPE
ncbi:hypothetical protein HNQ77_004695 [Silvibacterium bohemicum]|uniref:Uncharacterized protein n=1 Tax=Silvibacterium bohemicum TaxID=1577686 RepID=A0A841JZG7_9BACT|nr:hypothetical protein [Silvibacterium bohemicum]